MAHRGPANDRSSEDGSVREVIDRNDLVAALQDVLFGTQCVRLVVAGHDDVMVMPDGAVAIIAGLGEFLFGRRLLNTGAIFVPLIFIGLICTIVQTFLIYRYFSAPKKPPSSEFLRKPESEALGDVCIFVNMILFQVIWNTLTFAGFGRPSGIGEFLGRLFILCFLAMLIYFPPRMFYLVEDINRGRTWATMLLANSPVIIRVLIGTKEWS